MNTPSIGVRERLALIAELADRLDSVSPQFGKTVLVKLTYLLQEAYGIPLGYRYSFYTYGPYAPEVLSDLEQAKLAGAVKVDYVRDDPGGYVITKGDRFDHLKKEGEKFISAYEDKISGLVTEFGSFRARDLELRTTIVYLWKNVRTVQTGNRTELLSLMKQLKPHFPQEEVEQTVRDLQERGILSRSVAWS